MVRVKIFNLREKYNDNECIGYKSPLCGIYNIEG